MNTDTKPVAATPTPALPSKLSNQVGINPELRTAHIEAAALLDPILSGDAEGRWDPKGAQWR